MLGLSLCVIVQRVLCVHVVHCGVYTLYIVVCMHCEVMLIVMVTVVLCFGTMIELKQFFQQFQYAYRLCHSTETALIQVAID